MGHGGYKLKRTSIVILIFLAFSAVLHAQGKGPKQAKLDKQLQQKIKNGRLTDLVDVIIQGKTPSEVVTKVTGKGSIKRRFRHFPGVAIRLPLSVVVTLMSDPTLTAISIDLPVQLSSTDLTEVATSSSGAQAAYSRWGATGNGVGVAVIDSGIAIHPDLTNVVYSMDFTAGGSSQQTDPYGHGTHVAGIVAGSGLSSNGLYAGIAPAARLINLRVLDGTGNGSTSDVIAAIDWVMDNRNAPGNDGQSMNIRVINMSLGHMPMEGADTDPLSAAARMAVQSGIVVVAAAGNAGRAPDGSTLYGGVYSPGIEPSVITVGAMTTWGTPSRSDDTVASYSSRGPTIDGIIKPDITAPGSRIISTMAPGNALAAGYAPLQVDSNYMWLSGTSMASPVVAGSVAMILSQFPTLTPNAVKAILMYTAENRGNPLDFGAGYLNIAGAMDLAGSIDPTVATGQYWLTSPNLPFSEVINGYPAVWGQNLAWADSLYSGNLIDYNDPAFALNTVWGKTMSLGSSSVPGETLTLSNNVAGASTGVTGETIVWDDLGALTIVWEDAETIVWQDEL
jgi:serine protease AprX